MNTKQYVKGTRELNADDISIDDDIEFTDDENGHTVLNFYLVVWFEPSEVFGKSVGTRENDCWINLYANYNAGKRCVEDTLNIILNHDDGSIVNLCYELSDEEKAIIHRAMEEYCVKSIGIALDEIVDNNSA